MPIRIDGIFAMITKFLKVRLLGVFALIGMHGVVCAAEVPKALAGFFAVDKPVKAEIVVVVPPKEFQAFVQKLGDAAQKDPKWFEEHSKKTPAGSPIPLYDAKLGMTEEEYNNYKKLWDKREVKRVEQVGLMLQAAEDGKWKIMGSGKASHLSLLRYDPETDTFTSTNGEMSRIEDIAAPAASLFGEWKGKEWRYTSESSLGKVKENIALGMSADKKYGMLVYRLQEVSGQGQPLFDKSMVIRFVPVK